MSISRRGRRPARGYARRRGLSSRVMSALTMVMFLAIGLMAARLDLTPEPKRLHGPATVHDGDTLTIGGERLRLKGIDAPELGQVCARSGADYACGRDARQALAALVAGRSVACEGWRRDRYRRLLVDCSAGGVDLNRALIETGWAVAYGAYEAEEGRARAGARGLWAGDFDSPSDWRARQGAMAEEPHDALYALIGALREAFGFGGRGP